LNSTDTKEKPKKSARAGGERADPLDLLIEQVLVDTVPGPFVKGRKDGECPRSGYAILTKKEGKRLLIKTRCKTQRCVVCGPAVKAAIALKAEVGSWIHGPSWFITLTLRMGTEGTRDAVYVQKAFRAFLSKLKRDHEWTLKYMKVVELTKRGMPHLHLIVAGIPSGRVTRCRGLKNEKAWVENGCFENGPSCLLHIVSKTWLAVTGDSWVCDVSPTRSGLAAGKYISKYVGKWDQGEMGKLGFKRKWSATQGFTPDLHLRLRGTVEKKWIKTEHWDYQKNAEHWLLASRDDPALEIVGHPIVMRKYEMRRKRATRAFVEGMLRNAATLEAMDNEKGIDEYGRSGVLGAASGQGESEYVVAGKPYLNGSES